MRVDLQTYGPEPPDNNKTSRAGQRTLAQGPTSDSARVDHARFSFDQVRVQSLAAEVMAQPEIREQKVAALQTRLGKGGYTVSDAQISQAMVAERAGRNSGQ